VRWKGSEGDSKRGATERCPGEGPKIHERERETAQNNRNFTGCAKEEVKECESGGRLRRWRGETEFRWTLLNASR